MRNWLALAMFMAFTILAGGCADTSGTVGMEEGTATASASVSAATPSASASAAPSETMPAAGEDILWSGEWSRQNVGRFQSATLVIYNETKTSFEYELDAYSGGNVGFVFGETIIEGGAAVYKDDETGAELQFNLKDGVIEVTANKAASYFGGMGVVFDGTYGKGELPEDTLLTQGYVSSEEQDRAFHEMTGEDYELFLNSSQIPMQEDDLDGYGAEVYSWFVRGLNGYNNSIVMFLPDGTICAAVIDPENDEIKVYTNNDGITQTPKTILSWAERFQEMPIRFAGKAAS